MQTIQSTMPASEVTPNDNADQNWRRDNPPKIDRSRAYHHYLALADKAEVRLSVEVDTEAEKASRRLDRQTVGIICRINSVPEWVANASEKY